MDAIKCRRSRGYKPQTKQVVTLATYNLAVERGLQGLLSIRGLIGPHVSAVVASSMLSSVMGKLESRQHKQPSPEFSVLCVTAYSENVFSSISLCINAFLHKSNATSSERKLFCKLEDFFSKLWRLLHPFPMWYFKMRMKPSYWLLVWLVSLCHPRRLWLL